MGSQVNPWNLVSAAQYVEVKTSLTIYSPIHAPPSLILTAGAPQGYVLGPALFSLIHTARQHTPWLDHHGSSLLVDEQSARWFI